MNIDVGPLINERISVIPIEGDITFDKIDLEAVGIRRMEPVRVKGSIVKNYGDSYTLQLMIQGIMILPCSITLVDVEYPFVIEITEEISENNEEIENYYRIINNSLDILPIIWQNIVVEIPFKVISSNAELKVVSGDGWRLLTENDEKVIDPRLQVLKDLFKD